MQKSVVYSPICDSFWLPNVSLNVTSPLESCDPRDYLQSLIHHFLSNSIKFWNLKLESNATDALQCTVLSWYRIKCGILYDYIPLLRKGSLFGETGSLYEPFLLLVSLVSPYLYFRVPIFSVLAKNVNPVSGREKLHKLTSTLYQECIVHSKLWFVCTGLFIWM